MVGVKMALVHQLATRSKLELKGSNKITVSFLDSAALKWMYALWVSLIWCGTSNSSVWVCACKKSSLYITNKQVCHVIHKETSICYEHAEYLQQQGNCNNNMTNLIAEFHIMVLGGQELWSSNKKIFSILFKVSHFWTSSKIDLLITHNHVTKFWTPASGV